MPELPEVETIRRQLDPQLANAEITNGDAHWSDKFSPALDTIGSTITGVRRRGKYLLFDLVTDESVDAVTPSHELVAHLGMTGQFSIAEPADSQSAQGPHVRAWWGLDDGRTLVFTDVRRFGRLHAVDAGDYASITTLHHMGPEPLSDDFTGDSLYRALAKSSRPVKTQLLSQRPVAGVGNIYADEALFIARINPQARRVGKDRCHELASAIRTVLQTGIDNGGTTLRDYTHVDGEQGSNQHDLDVYGRGGEPCIECGRPLARITLDARTTTYCTFCQRH